MTLLCVTTEMHGRSCTIRDHHLNTCDNPDCKGCLPRPAEVGMLCYGCWVRFEAALSEVVDLVTHLWSIPLGGGAASDGEKGKPSFGPGWGGSKTMEAASAVRVALAVVAGVPAHPVPTIASVGAVARDVSLLVESINPEQTVARMEGAVAAVEFFRELQRVLHLAVRDDKPRRVKWVRCRQCDQETLLMRPPLEYLDDVVVQCTNPGCGAVWDPSLAAFDMRVLAETVSAEFAERGERIAKEAERLLKPAPADEAVPVCMEHAWGDVVMVNGPHELEVCSVCGEETTSGVYRRAAA